MRRYYTTISLTTQMIRLQAIKSPGIPVLHIAPRGFVVDYTSNVMCTLSIFD